MIVEELVCPRCGYAVQGDPPRCTSDACPLARQEAWHPEEAPVQPIDY
ncbi:MAG TPA: hypothetical protein VK060_01885 [Ruania sp.]|nr:hypothetical protein [Ruania sp.]